MPALAQDSTQAEIQHNISHVQRGYFTPSKPPERHEGEHRPLPERTAVQERRDRGPSWYRRHPSLAAWTREPLHRIAHDLVTANHPLPETAQCCHAQPNRAGLEHAGGGQFTAKIQHSSDEFAAWTRSKVQKLPQSTRCTDPDRRSRILYRFRRALPANRTLRSG